MSRFIRVHDQATAEKLYHSGLLWWDACPGHEQASDILGYMWFDPCLFALIDGLTERRLRGGLGQPSLPFHAPLHGRPDAPGGGRSRSRSAGLRRAAGLRREKRLGKFARSRDDWRSP